MQGLPFACKVLLTSPGAQVSWNRDPTPVRRHTPHAPVLARGSAGPRQCVTRVATSLPHRSLTPDPCRGPAARPLSDRRTPCASVSRVSIALAALWRWHSPPAATATDEPTAATASKAAGNGKLVIWADDQRSAALKPFAEQFGKENGVTVEVKEISKDQQTDLRHRLAAGQRPGHHGRRARLDRQPGAERRHRPGAADRGAEGRVPRDRDQGRHLQRPDSTACRTRSRTSP